MNKQFTDLSDIGLIFDNKLITTKEYMSVENNLVNQIINILNFYNEKEVIINGVSLKTRNLYVKDSLKKLYTEEFYTVYKKIENMSVLNLIDSEIFFRLAIRNDINAFAYTQNIIIDISEYMYVYIYIKRDANKILDELYKFNLYVEDWSDGFHKEDIERYFPVSYFDDDKYV